MGKRKRSCASAVDGSGNSNSNGNSHSMSISLQHIQQPSPPPRSPPPASSSFRAYASASTTMNADIHNDNYAITTTAHSQPFPQNQNAKATQPTNLTPTPQQIFQLIHTLHPARHTERQRLLRRRKTALALQEKDVAKRLEVEIEALGRLNLEEVAKERLGRALWGRRRRRRKGDLEEEEGFGERMEVDESGNRIDGRSGQAARSGGSEMGTGIFAEVDKEDRMNGGHDVQMDSERATARRNVVARLFRGAEVRKALAIAVEEGRRTLVVQEKADGTRNLREEAAGDDLDEEEEWEGFDDPDGVVGRELVVGSDTHDEEEDDEFSVDDSDDDDDDDVDEEERIYERYKSRLARSSDSSPSDSDVDGTSGENDFLSSKTIAPAASPSILNPKPKPSPSPTTRSFSPSLTRSPSPLPQQQPSRAHHPPTPPPTTSKPIKPPPPPPPPPTTTTTFLPTLQTSGYYSGSSSAASTSRSPSPTTSQSTSKRKNRMGQQARRALWEKKFKDRANHLRKQGMTKGGRGDDRDKGWDLRRGAVGAKDDDGRGHGRGRGRGRGRGGGRQERDDRPSEVRRGDSGRGGGGGGVIVRTGANAGDVGLRKDRGSGLERGKERGQDDWVVASKLGGGEKGKGGKGSIEACGKESGVLISLIFFWVFCFCSRSRDTMGDITSFERVGRVG